MENIGPFQYAIKGVIVWYRQVTGSRNLRLKLSDRSDFWHTSQMRCLSNVRTIGQFRKQISLPGAFVRSCDSDVLDIEMASCGFAHQCAAIENLQNLCFQIKATKLTLYLFLDSKVHGTNMGPTWVLSVPSGPHIGPMNLAIRDDTNPDTSSKDVVSYKFWPIEVVNNYMCHASHIG